MSDTLDNLMASVRQEAEARAQTLQRIFAGADSSRVFGQPIASGDYTVIPAAEIASGGGFGSGMGVGAPRWSKKQAAGQSGGAEAAGEQAGSALDVEGAGGGGGGGGGAMGRPVAVIVVGPDGVQVKPVVDATKLALTAVGAFGAVAAVSVKLLSKR